MRVAIFSRYPQVPERPRGGVESVTVALVQALAALEDMDVHVVTLESPRSEPLVSRHGLATIHRLPGSSWPQIADILMGPGRTTLLRYLQQLAPDVVHTHEVHGLTLRHRCTPHVHTVHGFDHANLRSDDSRLAWIRSPLWRQVERWGLSRHSDIISISPYVRNTIKPHTDACIHDIDNPVDERFFHLNRGEEPGRVLCAGWICERKNTLAAIRAFAHVVENGVKSVLAIAGAAQDPVYYRQVMACVDRYGLSDRVEFLGQIDRDQYLREMRRASVLVLPSRQENAPMVISEAMAAGLPVVTSSCCGMPYMVQDGYTGFLTDPDDFIAQAERLMRLLTNPRLRTEMGRSARQVALERFHPSRVARKTHDVYRQLAGSHT